MKKILLILSLFWAYTLFPQSQAANWYFGFGAGLKFDQSRGTVNSVNDGQLVTNEGCTTISDSNGILLFYTDGSTVYNKNHEIMVNGTNLYGDASSSQSAIIVPLPQTEDIYYIFTVDNDLDGRNFGLNYSVVDISKNDGLGEVIDKNVNLLEYCSEKITVVRKNCITGSFWLLTFSTANGTLGLFDTYRAYEITENGINTEPVLSNFNLGFRGAGLLDIRGYMVLSPDGKKMASANMTSGLYLYDFDDQTGILSNQQLLNLDPSANKSYGLAFSPDNELLYVHSSNDYFARDGSDSDPNNHYSILTQFDLKSADIQSSAVILDRRNLYRGALQLGPDGRIYRALSQTYFKGLPSLGTINNPNARGLDADYRHNSISLFPNESAQGLPPFIQSFFNEEIDIVNNDEPGINLQLCEGESYTLGVDGFENSSFSWTYNNVDLEVQSSTLEVDKSGHYVLTVTPNNGDCPLEGQAYVNFNPLPQTNNSQLIQCDVDGNQDGLSTFNLNEANDILSNYEDNRRVLYFSTLNEAQNSRSPLIAEGYQNNSNPERLFARIIDTETDCYSIAELNLTTVVTITQDAELSQCDDDGQEDGLIEFDLNEANNSILANNDGNLGIVYYSSTNDALLEIDPLPPSYTNQTPFEETIYARIENENNCVGINKLRLKVNPLPDIEIEETFLYCLNNFPEKLTINSGVSSNKISNFTYEWSTGETSESIDINSIGNYTVLVTNEFGCSRKRTVIVNPSNIATITDIDVVDVTNNNTITVSVSGEGNYEFIIDDEDGTYQDSNVLENVSAGIHTVFVRDKNGCGVSSEQVSVIGFPKMFSPNNDGINDYWNVKGISTQFQPNTTIFIYDRFGKLLKQLNPLHKGWDGTFNGQKLNSTDYWFSVLLEDGRLLKGHFSLRR